MDFLITKLRRQRWLAIPLRMLKYRLWRIPRLDTIIDPRLELGQLAKIVRRGPADDLTPRGSSPRILFFTLRGWTNHVLYDALTAQALRRRGADVRFFTCGGRLPICDINTSKIAPPMPCDFCAPYVERVLSTLQLPYQRMRDFVSPAEQNDIKREVLALSPDSYDEFIFEDLPIGKLVRPSAQWFLLSGGLGKDPLSRQTHQKFLVSGCIMARVAQRLLNAVKPDLLYISNGLFFAENILIALARQRAIPFITHEGGWFPDTQVFARNGIASYCKGIDEVWPAYAQRPLTEGEEKRLDAYLDERRQGKSNVKILYPQITSEAQSISQRLGLDPAKTLVTLFTNVNWDTSLIERPAAFPDMFGWMEATIRYFAARPDTQLVIRIHPAEVRLPFWEPAEKTQDAIRQRFQDLPGNVRVIPPESAISSYTLMDLSRLGLVYTSTVGMEMALRGKPVITTGTGYYSNRGFTLDAHTPAEYAAFLDRMNDFGPLDPQQVELARRYACLFFFRFQLPFPLTTSAKMAGRGIRLNFESLAGLRPGSDPYLDLICEAVLGDRPFIYSGPL